MTECCHVQDTNLSIDSLQICNSTDVWEGFLTAYFGLLHKVMPLVGLILASNLSWERKVIGVVNMSRDIVCSETKQGPC